MLAMPAMAQVDWGTIAGKTGPSTCPPGITESRTTLMHFNAPSAGETSVRISNAATSRSSLGMWAGRPGTTSFNVALAVRDRNDMQVGRHNFGTITSTLSQQTKTFENLKAGQRYAARIEVAPADTSAVIVKCFQIPPNLNYVENLVRVRSVRPGALPLVAYATAAATAQIDRSAIAWCYRTIDLHHPDWETPSFSLSNKNTG